MADLNAELVVRDSLLSRSNQPMADLNAELKKNKKIVIFFRIFFLSKKNTINV